jgi:hypothetical protein
VLRLRKGTAVSTLGPTSVALTTLTAAVATAAAAANRDPPAVVSTTAALSTTVSDLAVATPCTVCRHAGLCQPVWSRVRQLCIPWLVCRWCAGTWHGMDYGSQLWLPGEGMLRLRKADAPLAVGPTSVALPAAFTAAAAAVAATTSAAPASSTNPVVCRHARLHQWIRPRLRLL